MQSPPPHNSGGGGRGVDSGAAYGEVKVVVLPAEEVGAEVETLAPAEVVAVVRPAEGGGCGGLDSIRSGYFNRGT